MCVFLCVSRIAEKEKQWEVKIKEALARKAQRVKAVQCDRDKMIADVSIQQWYTDCKAIHYQ